ncbi:MAG: hypothetical protein P8P74_08260 [Crocinitomicaceae bacterium]|nr:hypothetical protein [Crocinitomicaceae bacterium]
MTHFKSVQFSDNNRFEHIYENATAEEIGTAIEKALSQDRYIIKSGNLGDRNYTKGNRVLRLMLGAFYKYFEFNVDVKEQDDKTVMAAIRKTSTGMSGGLIGVNQVKKELKRLETVLQNI